MTIGMTILLYQYESLLLLNNYKYIYIFLDQTDIYIYDYYNYCDQ
jgi:hypothetical protein